MSIESTSLEKSHDIIPEIVISENNPNQVQETFISMKYVMNAMKLLPIAFDRCHKDYEMRATAVAISILCQ